MGYHYFVAGEVSSEALIDLIEAVPNLIATFEYVNTMDTIVNNVSGVDVEIVFSEDLSAANKTTLDGIVSAYALAAPLQIAKAAKLQAVQDSINAYIDLYYPFLIRTQLFNLYILAKFDLLVLRAAYIRPGINWINSITVYGMSVYNTVNAMTNVDTINAFTWDIASHVGSNPQITLAGALGINA